MSDPSPHLSSLRLNARALGGLTPQDRAAQDAHLLSCERCQEVAAELQAESDRFTRDVFPRTLQAVEARASGSRWKSWWWLPAAGLAALAALPVALGVWRLPQQPREDLATKGGSLFQVFAKRGVEVFAVREGTTLQPGDQLRFVVEPGDSDHVLIASVDGAGKASIYYPYDAVESGAVTPQTRSELPGSLTLDGTLGEERLLALFSRRPLQAAEVLRALQAVKPESLAGGVPSVPADSQRALEFKKASP